MAVRELELLRHKVQELIASNLSLRQEKRSVAEKLHLRERQIRELMERCERYERNRKDAFQRLSAVLEKVESLR
jgi:hypothetical protein